MGGSSAPPAPNYVGAAQAQGAANLETAIAQGQMNNPNVINPYGTQTIKWAGNIPTITQTLNPAQQALLDQQNKGKSILGDAGINVASQVKNSLSNPLDFSKLPGVPTSQGSRDDVVKAMMARVDTDTAGQRSAKNAELIAAGIRPGTEAYQTAMTQIDRQYNDARNNAILAGTQAAAQDFNQDMATHTQSISDLLAQRDTALNEINALQTGSQVSNPFAGNLGFQGGATVGQTPMFQAITNQGQAQQNIYNQQQAQQNANINAGAGLLGSVGSAWLGR